MAFGKLQYAKKCSRKKKIELKEVRNVKSSYFIFLYVLFLFLVRLRKIADMAFLGEEEK